MVDTLLRSPTGQEGDKLTDITQAKEGKKAAFTEIADRKATWKCNSEFRGIPLTLVFTTTTCDLGKISGIVAEQPVGVKGTKAK